MKISGGLICYFVIIMTIIELSLEDCQIIDYGYPCKPRLPRYNRLCENLKPDASVVSCTDLNDLNMYKKEQIQIIEIKNNGSLDEIRSGLFEGFIATIFINISNSNVRDVETDAFRNLSNLEFIDLSGNSINGLSEGIFNGIPKLRDLNLSRNKINCLNANNLGTNPKEIADRSSCSMINCESLVVLDLSENVIENLEIYNCTNLQEVNLEGNNINIHSEIKMQNLTELDVLNLARNKLTCLEVANSKQLSNESCPMINFNSLYSLDLSNNRLESVKFYNCTGLRRVILNGNNLKSLKNALFKNVSITILDLTNNNLNYITRDHLHDLPNLRSLDLSQNPLFENNDMPTNLIYGMKHLSELNLSRTSLKRLIFGAFTTSVQLYILDLSFNELTHIPRYLFSRNFHLRTLDLTGNHLTSLNLDSFPLQIKLNLNDNLMKCKELGELNADRYGLLLVPGSTYNTTNYIGIKCLEDSQDQTKNDDDPVALGNQYLSFLVRGQDDMKQQFIELRNLLSESNIYQRNNFKNNIELIDDTLFMKDAILYGICLVGFTLLIIFLTLYYRYFRKDQKNDRVLTTFNISS